MLVILFEKDDYDEELKDIRQASKYLSNREEVRIGLLSDKKLIKRYKKETSWFESSAAFNSFIVKRYDGEMFINDLITTQSFKN